MERRQENLERESADGGTRRRTRGTHVTYERGVSEGGPDVSVLVKLTVLSELWKKINTSVN